MSERALGLIETNGLVAAIEACDAMLKAAKVELKKKEVTIAGLVTIEIIGETGAVKSAVAAGVDAAERVGKVIAQHIIPRPDPQVENIFYENHITRDGPGLRRQLNAMTVQELRQIARETPDFEMGGREISSANKADLLALLKKHYPESP